MERTLNERKKVVHVHVIIERVQISLTESTRSPKIEHVKI